MTKYSAFNLLKNALSFNKHWTEAWRNPEPKREYDAIIVGGGGHGLATAYYLAKEHGLRNIAVVEKGWIGGGNTGRNTTIVRSNYLWTEASLLYEKSLKLWEGLGYYSRARNLQRAASLVGPGVRALRYTTWRADDYGRWSIRSSRPACARWSGMVGVTMAGSCLQGCTSSGSNPEAR